MAEKIFLTVVIPCYNESENLQRGILSEVASELENFEVDFEVIISDDKSTDNSLNLIKKFKHPKFKILENPHGGKAYALRSGLTEAKGEFVLFTDMDQSTPMRELGKLLPYARQGKKVIIGSRGTKRVNFNISRQIASKVFSLVRKAILLPHIVDTQCGFKMFDRKLALKIFEKMLIFSEGGRAQGWVVAAWDVEFLFLAEKLGNQITEVEVDWKDADESTQKKRTAKKFVRESLDMLKQILRVRLNDFKGRYEK